MNKYTRHIPLAKTAEKYNPSSELAFVAKRVAQARDVLSITQEALAIAAEVDLSTLKNLEQGKPFQFTTLLKICYVLSLDLYELICPDKVVFFAALARAEVELSPFGEKGN